MVECGTYGSVYFLKRLLMSLLSMCARCTATGQVCGEGVFAFLLLGQPPVDSAGLLLGQPPVDSADNGGAPVHRVLLVSAFMAFCRRGKSISP